MSRADVARNSQVLHWNVSIPRATSSSRYPNVFKQVVTIYMVKKDYQYGQDNLFHL